MNDMIPRIIHYCWFGNNSKSLLIKKCIHSWEKNCPDYKIMEWSENNFDIDEAPKYVLEAYKARKWAFVADYVRFFVLLKYGGIYLDTDVELLKPLDPFLRHNAFTGVEDNNYVNAAVIGCMKGYPLFQDFLSYYQNRSFYKEDGNMDMTTVVSIITGICKDRGYKNTDLYQEIDGMAIYPSEYFYPLSNVDKIMRKTEKTVAIHWFAGSWVPKEEKRKMREFRRKKNMKYFFRKLMGQQRYDQVKKLLGRG